jgi:cytochrome c peroxidase
MLPRFASGILVSPAVAVACLALSAGAASYLEQAAQMPPQTPASLSPTPAAGPLAEPKSLNQLGVPIEATRATVPADNPQTPGKIARGEKLFFDGRLSVDGTVACSTCHDPARAFTDGSPCPSASKVALDSAMRRPS